MTPSADASEASPSASAADAAPEPAPSEAAVPEAAVTAEPGTPGPKVAAAARRARSSVMGVASVAGKPLAGARIKHVKKLYGKRLRFAGKPDRTDADGNFLVALAARKLPKTFVVTIASGRYGNTPPRGSIQSLGHRKEFAEFVNEASTLAVWVQKLTGMSAKKSTRFTSRYLCLPNPGPQLFSLGSATDNKTAYYSPEKMQRKANRKGGLSEYVAALADDASQRGSRNCFKPKKWKRLIYKPNFVTVANQDVASSDVKAEFVVAAALTVAEYAGPIIEDLVGKEFANVVNDVSCDLDKETGGISSVFIDCEKPGDDPMASVIQKLDQIGTKLNSLDEKVTQIQKSLLESKANVAFKEAGLGVLRNNITVWTAMLKSLSTAKVALVPELDADKLPSDAEDGEVCKAAYREDIRIGSQTPREACNLIAKQAIEFEKLAPDLVTAITGLRAQNQSRSLLIPAVQAVRIGPDQVASGADIQAVNNSIGTYVVDLTLGMMFSTAWKAFRNQWTQASPGCNPLPTEYSRTDIGLQPILFNNACAALETTQFVLSAIAVLSGNGPVALPADVVISNSRETRGWAWWRYPIDLTGTAKYKDNGLPRYQQSQGPYFPAQKKVPYIIQYLRSGQTLSRLQGIASSP